MAKESRTEEDHGYFGAEWRRHYAQRRVPRMFRAKSTVNRNEAYEKIEKQINEKALCFLREAEEVDSSERYADRAELLWKYGYITNSDFFKERSRELIDREFYDTVTRLNLIYKPKKI